MLSASSFNGFPLDEFDLDEFDQNAQNAPQPTPPDAAVQVAAAIVVVKEECHRGVTPLPFYAGIIFDAGNASFVVPEDLPDAPTPIKQSARMNH